MNLDTCQLSLTSDLSHKIPSLLTEPPVPMPAPSPGAEPGCSGSASSRGSGLGSVQMEPKDEMAESRSQEQPERDGVGGFRNGSWGREYKLH